MAELLRIGLCGGTFDPFHRGHTEPLEAVCSEMQWDRILYIPANRQPFKQSAPITSGWHRFAMTLLGTTDAEHLDVSIMELERGGISYTAETVAQLRTLWPEAVLDWVIGDDNLSMLPEWRSIESIFDAVNILVLSRGGQPEIPAQLRRRVRPVSERDRSGSLVFARNAVVEISATEIRRQVRANEAFESCVHPRVAAYIRKHGLYLDHD